MKAILSLFGKILRKVLLLGLLMLIVPRLMTALNAINRLYTVDSAPERPVAIVFGAGLWWNGQPTPVLRDRVATAVELYNSGKVSWLLMSGSQSGTYNEPQAMFDYAVNLGMPAEAIVLDNAGDRTYDTCYRALHTYNIHTAILVTQRFHQPRALYTCNKLGIEAIGVEADMREYRRSSLMYWNLRELPATLSAMLDVHLLQPEPVVNAPKITPFIPLVD
jgi:SanA protein